MFRAFAPPVGCRSNVIAMLQVATSLQDSEGETDVELTHPKNLEEMYGSGQRGNDAVRRRHRSAEEECEAWEATAAAVSEQAKQR